LVADGLDLPIEIVDSRFGMPCLFQDLSDGSFGCVPQPPDTGNIAYSADPVLGLCNGTPLAVYSSLRLAPGEWAESRFINCAYDVRVVAFDAEIAPTAPFSKLYAPTGGCGTSNDATGLFAYKVTGSVAGALVTANEEHVALTAHTDARVFAASDGSRVFLGDVYDRVFGVRVIPQAASDLVVRLLPTQQTERGMQTGRPTDGGVGTFSYPNYCVPPGPFFPEYRGYPRNSYSCDIFPSGLPFAWVVSGGIDGLFPLRAAVSSTYECVVAEGYSESYQAGVRGYFLDAPIPFCAMEQAPTLQVGTGRLRASYPSVGGAPLFRPSGLSIVLHDTALGVDCAARVTDDGVLRCVPHAASAGNIGFKDPQCTQRVAEIAPGSDAAYALEHDENASLAFDRHVYQVLGLTTSSAVYEHTQTGACVGPLNRPAALHDVAVVPADTFAPVSVVDP
jgi:hypothetical protein